MTKIKIHSSWKTGSGFVRSFYRFTSNIAKTKYINITKDNWSKPINLNNYCACGYRFFADNENLNNKKIIHIIQLRDPRDMLVSLYFSMAYSHTYGQTKNTEAVHNHTKAININDFVLQKIKKIKLRYEKVFNTSNHNNIIYLHYDEMVLNFEKWFEKSIKPFMLDESQKQTIFNKFKDEFNNIPKENVMNHKRKVIPGDYLEKLNTNTIEKLNHEFKNILDFINNTKTK